MNLFYINTFYVAAVPLWWAAAVLMRFRSPGADTFDCPASGPTGEA
jgi:hypothetical protein